MKAKAKLLNVENISGTSTKSGSPKDYNMDMAHFLDLDTFDKFRLLAPKDQINTLRANSGREGVLTLGIDPRTEKAYFIAFEGAKPVGA